MSITISHRSQAVTDQHNRVPTLNAVWVDKISNSRRRLLSPQLGQGLIISDTRSLPSRGVAMGFLAQELAPRGGGEGPCQQSAAKPAKSLENRAVWSPR